jgi:hypothetical protein
MNNKKIAIIAELNSKEKILLLSNEYYLWFLESLENNLAVEGLGEEFSCFPFCEEYSIDDYIECYLETVIEHHPKWEKILLVGTFNIEMVKLFMSPYKPLSM